MPEWYKESFDELYSEIYSHRDDEEAALAIELLGRCVRLAGSNVLDVCCGQGRHLRALSRAGAKGYGLDLSAALLQEQRGSLRPYSSACVRGDMRRLPFRGATFDACVNMFTSLGYFGREKEELAVLEEMYRVLRPGGYCFVDHANVTWLRKHLRARTVRRAKKFTILEKRVFLEDGRTVEKSIDVFPGVPRPRALSGGSPLRSYRELVTFFTLEELRGLMARAGFETVGAFGNYEGSPFSERLSPRLMVLARKRK
jgi:ubiquinone/menaquinone biosynthesis C-methylase UbiE